MRALANVKATDRLVLSPAMRRTSILEFLRLARRRICLSLFRCDDSAIVNELAASACRGVNVQILMTQRAHGWNQKLKDLSAELEAAGVCVRRHTGELMKYHAKYVVVDDERALITSLNFTHKCLEKTHDFLLFTEDSQIVSRLKVLFEIDSYAPDSSLPDMPERLLVAPDQARKRLLKLFQSAQQDISIMDHRLADPQVIALLDEKARHGVSVRINGPDVRDAHGRVFLIDHTIAIIGSMHLSPPSLDLRREVGVITRDPAIVAELYKYTYQWSARN